MRSQFRTTAEAIRRWMGKEGLKSGMRLPSVNALAVRLGFKSTTMHRACQVLVSEGALKREGNRLMVGTNNRSVLPVDAVIYVASYLEDCGRAICRKLAERGAISRLIKLSYKNRNLHLILKKLLAEKPAGLILWTNHLEEATGALLNSTPIPVTVCADGRNHLKRSLAQTDYVRGVEKALRHLLDLGHRNIAYVTLSLDWLDEEIMLSYRTACFNLELKPLVWQFKDQEAGIHASITTCLKRHPEVTAILCRHDVGAEAAKVLRVPQALSVVIVNSLPVESGAPLFTTIAHSDSDLIFQWASTNIIEQIQTLASGLPPKPSSHVYFVPDLLERETTRPHGKKVDRASLQPSPTKTDSDLWSDWQNIYPFLKKSDARHWLQLDLSTFVNHSMTRPHGWLGGEPLAHFPPGLRDIHGVPFRVLDEKQNNGRSVLTFRSPHSHSARNRQLPVRVKVKVGHPIKALYFLHGCGNAKPVPFARYLIHFAKGPSSSITLVPFGSSRRASMSRTGVSAPNIQDWWSGFEQMDFPHAHHFTVFDPSDPSVDHRTLYSLEWMNPRPKEKVTHIEIQVDPKTGPTLAVIAMTALLLHEI